MILTKDFKSKIAGAFYDKTFTKYTVSNIVDDEGWSRDGSLVSNGTFLGNAFFDKLAEYKEKFGISEDIQIVVSCSTEEETDIHDIFEYDNRYYRVIDSRPYDSYKLIFGQVWSSKSSTSPSV